MLDHAITTDKANASVRSMKIESIFEQGNGSVENMAILADTQLDGGQPFFCKLDAPMRPAEIPNNRSKTTASVPQLLDQITKVEARTATYVSSMRSKPKRAYSSAFLYSDLVTHYSSVGAHTEVIRCYRIMARLTFAINPTLSLRALESYCALDKYESAVELFNDLYPKHRKPYRKALHALVSMFIRKRDLAQVKLHVDISVANEHDVSNILGELREWFRSETDSRKRLDIAIYSLSHGFDFPPEDIPILMKLQLQYNEFNDASETPRLNQMKYRATHSTYTLDHAPGLFALDSFSEANDSKNAIELFNKLYPGSHKPSRKALFALISMYIRLHDLTLAEKYLNLSAKYEYRGLTILYQLHKWYLCEKDPRKRLNVAICAISHGYKFSADDLLGLVELVIKYDVGGTATKVLETYLEKAGQTAPMINQWVHLMETNVTKTRDLYDLLLVVRSTIEIPLEIHHKLIRYFEYKVGEDASHLQLYVDRMRKDGVILDAYTYAHLITKCNASAAFDAALSHYAVFQSLNIPANILLCNSIITTYGRLHRVDMIEVIYKSLIAEGISPNLHTFHQAVSTSVKNDNPDKAAFFLKEMDARDDIPRVHEYYRFRFSFLLGAYSKCGNTRGMMYIMNMYKQHAVNPDIFTYNQLIFGFVAARKFTRARDVWEGMKCGKPIPWLSIHHIPCRPSNPTFALMLDLCRFAGRKDKVAERALALLYEVWECAQKGSVEATPNVLTSMIEALIEFGGIHVDTAIDYIIGGIQGKAFPTRCIPPDSKTINHARLMLEHRGLDVPLQRLNDFLRGQPLRE